MGGELCFAIRRSDGRERVWLEWTNIMPLIFADVDFIKEGRAVDDIWGRGSFKDRWPNSRRVNLIQPSEYGVVLVDFKNKKLFSRQGYCEPGSLCCLETGGLPGARILALHSEKRITRVDDWSGIKARKGISKSKLAKYLDTHRAALREDTMGYGDFHIINYDMKPLVVDHDPRIVISKNWGQVKAFLKENGWQTRTRK